MSDSSAATLARPASPAKARPNPLRAGIDSNRIQDPCNIIFFGASGDLMKRMLMPAIYNLRLEDMLPSDFGIVGFSRSSFTDEQFRAEMATVFPRIRQQVAAAGSAAPDPPVRPPIDAMMAAAEEPGRRPRRTRSPR